MSSLTEPAHPGRDGIRRSGYIYVDHGEDFRRQHAIAFPGDETAAVTLASADWALDYLLRRGGSGYLPRRHASAAIAAGRLREVPDAPRFKRRVYVVASTQATAQWDWFEAALEVLRQTMPTPSPSMGEGRGGGDGTSGFGADGEITPTQPSPIRGEGFDQE